MIAYTILALTAVRLRLATGSAALCVGLAFRLSTLRRFRSTRSALLCASFGITLARLHLPRVAIGIAFARLLVATLFTVIVLVGVFIVARLVAGLRILGIPVFALAILAFVVFLIFNYLSFFPGLPF